MLVISTTPYVRMYQDGMWWNCLSVLLQSLKCHNVHHYIFISSNGLKMQSKESMLRIKSGTVSN